MRLLTVDDLTDRVPLSRGRIYKLARSGALPARRLTPRGRLYFDPDEIERALRPAVGPCREGDSGQAGVHEG
jgi:hypothetical protein